MRFAVRSDLVEIAFIFGGQGVFVSAVSKEFEIAGGRLGIRLIGTVESGI